MNKLILILLLIPSSSFAQDAVSAALEACDQTKDIKVCQDLQVIKKNVEYTFNNVVKDYSLTIPVSAIGFMIRPEIKLNKKDHELKLTPTQVTYSYQF